MRSVSMATMQVLMNRPFMCFHTIPSVQVFVVFALLTARSVCVFFTDEATNKLCESLLCIIVSRLKLVCGV